jgi:hypothetical protein
MLSNSRSILITRKNGTILMLLQYTLAPVHSGVIRRTGNEMRGRGISNLTWEESVKRDLKDWSITKELSLDRREWKLAIHVSESWSSVSSPLLSFCQSFFFLFVPFPFFWLSVFLSFLLFSVFFITLCFPPSFFVLVLSLFFSSCGFISSLPQLVWD